jgi:hypothetical protein
VSSRQTTTLATHPALFNGVEIQILETRLARDFAVVVPIAIAVVEITAGLGRCE